MPRGVLAVVAIGLLACVVAALLSTDKAGGEAANLEWVQTGPVPDSKPVSVPGGNAVDAADRGQDPRHRHQRRRLLAVPGRHRAEDRQGCPDRRRPHPLLGHRRQPPDRNRPYLGWAADHLPALLRKRHLRPGRAGNARCSTSAPTAIELAVLEVGDLPNHVTATRRASSSNGPSTKKGHGAPQILPPRRQAEGQDLELPFNTVWKTKGVAPAAKIACTLTTSAGNSTVETAGALKHISPPINEDLEEEREEAREEKAEGEEE